VRACSQRRAHFSGFLFCLLLVCAFVYFLRCFVELFVVVLYCTFTYGIGRWWGDEWYLLIAGFAVYYSLIIQHEPKGYCRYRKERRAAKQTRESKQANQTKEIPVGRRLSPSICSRSYKGYSLVVVAPSQWPHHRCQVRSWSAVDSTGYHANTANESPPSGPAQA